MANASPPESLREETSAAHRENLVVESRAKASCLDAIALIADAEADFSDSVYRHYFARRPDSRSLFGEHSINEREEMVRETMKSLIAWLEGETWLEENLRVLGRSHAEYGVEGDMYPPFVEALVECAAEIGGEHISPETLATLRAGCESIAFRMRAAGEDG